jgi:hypothetical protein
VDSNLTVERLREVLRYEPETGKFFWLKGNNQRLAGDEAGSVENKGYVRIKIDGMKILAHRLAWLWMSGEWPFSRIDHKNMIRTDNRWINLRLADDSKNMANKHVHKNNFLGVKGVRLHECGKYVARISVKGTAIYLGIFDTITAAQAAYEIAAKEFYGEFARTS